MPRNHHKINIICWHAGSSLIDLNVDPFPLLGHIMGATSSVRQSCFNPSSSTGEINEHKLCVPFHKSHPTVSSSKTCGYEIAYKLGDGAFSDVRAACRKDNKDKVSIKELNLAYYVKEYVKEAQFEFNILSQLNHPYILKLYEVFYSKNVYYMVTELLLGGELFDSICERDRYTENDARKVMQTVTETLRYCHNRKVIHRDIKPENLILQDKSSNSKIKLIDFGFARVVPEKTTFTEIRGSSMYLSPEMIGGCYSYSTDVWSLGVVFYILLSGVYPFESPQGDVEETKEIISRGKYTFPAQHWVGVSLQARDLVDRMLTVDTEKRITMEGILSHPWMTNEKNKEVDISRNIETIKAFQKNKRMKTTALAVKATVAFKSGGSVLNLREKLLAAAKTRTFSRGDSSDMIEKCQSNKSHTVFNDSYGSGDSDDINTKCKSKRNVCSERDNNPATSEFKVESEIERDTERGGEAIKRRERKESGLNGSTSWPHKDTAISFLCKD